jgi:hypothetical protein
MPAAERQLSRTKHRAAEMFDGASRGTFKLLFPPDIGDKINRLGFWPAETGECMRAFLSIDAGDRNAISFSSKFPRNCHPIPESPPVTHITGEALLLTPGCRGMIRGKLHSCG